MKMVATRGKKKSANSDITLQENETAENGLAEIHSDLLTVDVIKSNENAQLEDKIDLITDESRNENFGEMSGEGEKVAGVDNEDPSMPVTETNGDSEAELGENIFEDDETDDQGDMLSEDEEGHFEHEDGDRVLNKYEASEEGGTEEDDEYDGVSEEEATEEDEVSEEEGTKEKNDKENNQEKENAEQDTIEAKVKEDGRAAKKHDIERSEANLKNITKSNERSRKKKVQAGRLKKVDSEDKPESSRKRMMKKRVQSMGMIFMCSSETKKDCYQYRVLGLPESKKDIVEKIYTGMRLFLYDLDLKLMYGIYKAAGPGGYNIIPKAFKAQFPSQVRFKVLENCLPLAEEKFKKVIKENYYTKTKFDCQLNSEQVKKLCRLFTASNKGHPTPSKKLGASLKAAKHPVRQERSRRQRTGDKKRPPLRKEVRHHERPHKRPRKVMSPARPPRQHLPPPLPSTIPSVYEDAYRQNPYIERRSPYRDRRDLPLIPVDPYGVARDPPIERNECYRDGRNPPLERHYAYSGGRDSHIERRDPYMDDVESYQRRRESYRDGRALYLESRDPYRYGQDPYTERRDSYRDGRDSYIERLDSLRDGRAPYLERRVPYGESAHSELYSTYRRLPLSDSLDVYRDGRGVEFRDSYRRDELVGRRDLHPIDLETRSHHDIAGRDAYVSSRRPSDAYVSSRERPSDAYVSNRERPSDGGALYPAAYPLREDVYRL